MSQKSLGRGDHFRKIVGVQLTQPLPKNRQIYGRWDAIVRCYNDERDQNHDNHSLLIGQQWSRQSEQLDLSVNLQHYRLDNSLYRALYGPSLGWSKALDMDLTLQLRSSWLRLEHPDISWRDSQQLLFNLRLYGTLDLAYSPTWFAGAFWGNEWSDNQSVVSKASVDRHFSGLQTGTQLSIAEDWSLLLAATAQGSNYDGQDWIYGLVRDDSYHSIDLELKHLLDANWQLSLNFNYSKNKSNIELYEYDRRQLSLALRYEF